MVTTILGFGASSMQGVGDSKGGFFKRLERPSLVLINKGKGGDTTTDMAARLEPLRAIERDWTVILLGCNDMPRGNDGQPQKRNSLDMYRRNLTTIFSELRSRNNLFITSFLVRAGVVDHGLFADYMRVAMEEVNGVGGYQIWDLHAASKAFGDRYLAPDGVHYNDAGHQFICDDVLKRINSL